MSTELALIESALSITQVMEQRKLVMQLMKEAMTEGLHYGRIPGCGDKPTLMQPGAQLMACAFRLAPEYKITESSPMIGHREYAVSCRLTHGGTHIAEGVGLCSSMESKFRYRSAAPSFEETGDAIPADSRERKEEYRKQGYGMKQISGAWKWVKYSGGDNGKVENPNIADVFNTVLKMAKKRAYVDACITATACNDLFTQDLEDIRENLAAVEVESHVMPSRPEQPDKPAEQQPAREEPPAQSYDQKKQEFERTTKPPVQQEMPQGESIWQGRVITNVEDVRGNTRGKDWCFYKVSFDDGTTANTFSEPLATECRHAGGQSDTVHATVKPGKKANSWELVKIEVDSIPI